MLSTGGISSLFSSNTWQTGAYDFVDVDCVADESSTFGDWFSFDVVLFTFVSLVVFALRLRVAFGGSSSQCETVDITVIY